MVNEEVDLSGVIRHLRPCDLAHLFATGPEGGTEAVVTGPHTPSFPPSLIILLPHFC